MRFVAAVCFGLAVSATAHAALIEDCFWRLSNRNIRDNFIAQVAQPWRLSSFQGTPLEVSAYMREWKTDLAERVGISPDRVSGKFSRGSLGFEENSRPDEARVLMIRTRNGLRGIILLNVDLARQSLTYLDPLFPRAMSTSFGEITEGHRPSLRLAAFEDQFDRSGVAGNILGVITVKVPGLKLNP